MGKECFGCCPTSSNHTCCDSCIKSDCCNETSITVICILLAILELIIAILSGIASHRSGVSNDTFSALMFVAFSPIFWFLILIEQSYSCCPEKCCVPITRMIFMCGILTYFVFQYIYLFGNFNPKCWKSECDQLPITMMKLDGLLYGIIGIPLLLYYFIINTCMLCSGYYEWQSCGSYGRGYYVSSSQPTYTVTDVSYGTGQWACQSSYTHTI